MQDLTLGKSAVNVPIGDIPPVTCTVGYPIIHKALFLMFCGYVVTWYLQVGYRIPALGAIRFEFIYAAVLAVLALFLTPKIDKSCPLIPYVFLYFLVIVIQVPFSHDFNTSLNIFIDRIVKFAFMAFFIVAFVRSPTHIKYFLGAFLLACLKMGQEGLVGRISGALIWENQGIMRLHGSTPLYDHPNSFAGMALGTLPFVYFLWPVCNKYLKAGLLAIGILSLHIILYSGSRTGYVGVLSFLVFAFLITEQKKKFLAYLALALVIALPKISTDYQERFRSIFTHEEKEGKSTEARIEIFKDACQIFAENPLGVGVAAFPRVRMERFGRMQDTHNLYLEIATNLGIHGVVVVGLMLYKMLCLLQQIRLRAKDLLLKIRDGDLVAGAHLLSDLAIIECVASATIGFLIIRLTLGIFGMDLYEIYWWFAIGITVALYAMLKRINTDLAE